LLPSASFVFHLDVVRTASSFPGDMDVGDVGEEMVPSGIVIRGAGRDGALALVPARV